MPRLAATMAGWWILVGALAGILAVPRGIHGWCFLGGERACFFLNQLLGVLCRSGGYRRAVWELMLEAVRQDSVASWPLLQHQTNHRTDALLSVLVRMQLNFVWQQLVVYKYEDLRLKISQ